MEILNVIEIKFGIVSTITSYVMDTIREIPYEESKKIMVDKAEIRRLPLGKIISVDPIEGRTMGR